MRKNKIKEKHRVEAQNFVPLLYIKLNLIENIK